MKKFILILTLATLLLPMITSAQKTCCKLKQDVKYENTTYGAKCYISETSGTNPDCEGTALPMAPCPDAPNVTYSGCGLILGGYSTPRWGIICFLNTINQIFGLVFVILMALVSIMVIIGAFTIVTAGGDPQKVTQGKNYILYAIIGMVVAIFARAIPAIVALVL